MIVAIERNKFTYLYKYNQIRVDINQIIDKTVDNLKWMLKSDFNGILQLFNKTIPLFEQDHEIILLEVDKSKIKFQEGIVLSFGSILCIYPLTIIGSKLLDGKISEDFIVELPVFEKGIESLKIIRSMELRRNTSEKLLAHFNLQDIVNKERILGIETAVKKNLLYKNQPQLFTTFLDHLIAFNKTPSYIPDGNIEQICKIGAIAIKYLGKPEEVFTNGPFYKSILKYKSKINSHSYLASYLKFITIDDSELKLSYYKMVDLIAKEYQFTDVFKVSYFFLAFKSFINKNDNSLEGINEEIILLINQDRDTAAIVLSLLGYTFSFENIYEGIHRLSDAPLLKSTHRKREIELEKAKRAITSAAQKRDSSIDVTDESIKKKTIKEIISEVKNGPVETIPNDPFEKETIKEIISEVKNGPVETIPNDQMEKETIKEIISEVTIDSVETIPNDSDEKTEEINGTNPLETVSEPIVIYEANNSQAQKEDNLITITNTKTQEEEQTNDDTEEFDEITAEKKLLTVHDFRSDFLKEQTKPRQKIWFEILDQFFPSKHEEISLEIFLDRLDNIPKVKDKLLKNNKDKESIKAFFDAYKKE